MKYILIKAMEVPARDRLALTSFSLDDLNLTDDETCLAAIRMFMDLEIISRFKIPYKVSKITLKCACQL